MVHLRYQTEGRRLVNKSAQKIIIFIVLGPALQTLHIPSSPLAVLLFVQTSIHCEGPRYPAHCVPSPICQILFVDPHG